MVIVVCLHGTIKILTRHLLNIFLCFICLSFNPVDVPTVFHSWPRAESVTSFHHISIVLSLGLHPEMLRERKILGQILRPLLEAKLHEHSWSKDHCCEGKVHSCSFESWLLVVGIENTEQQSAWRMSIVAGSGRSFRTATPVRVRDESMCNSIGATRCASMSEKPHLEEEADDYFSDLLTEIIMLVTDLFP